MSEHTPMTPEEARKYLKNASVLGIAHHEHRALETIVNMKAEWGVEIEGKIPGTWYRLNLQALAPDHYADAAWLETREEAESLISDVIEGGWYRNARLVHRYVSGVITDE